MKPNPWIRLIEAARRAPPDPWPTMPFGFDTRVVAGWQTGANRPDGLRGLRQLRQALAVATAIMLMSLTLKFLASQSGEPNEMTYVESAVQLASMP